jgi:hypothetical protein
MAGLYELEEHDASGLQVFVGFQPAPKMALSRYPRMILFPRSPIEYTHPQYVHLRADSTHAAVSPAALSTAAETSLCHGFAALQSLAGHSDVRRAIRNLLS